MIRRILTRTEAAEVTRLTTLETLKTELGDDSETNDALYGRVIDYCSNEISAYLNTDADESGDATIGREEVSETFYGVGGHVELLLSRQPIGDLVSVTEGSTVERLIDDEVNPSFTYIVKKSSGLVFKPSFAVFSDTVTVVYTAGWILPGEEGRTLPYTIEDACIRFCRVKLDQVNDGEDLAGALTGAEVDGVGKFQFSGQTGSIGRGLPYEVRNLLERYKAPTLA